MTPKAEGERYRAIAASERADAAASTLANVRDLKLRSAARWDELAERQERIVNTASYKGGSGW